VHDVIKFIKDGEVCETCVSTRLVLKAKLGLAVAICGDLWRFIEIHTKIDDVSYSTECGVCTHTGWFKS
jgi:hypothetical protein